MCIANILKKKGVTIIVDNHIFKINLVLKKTLQNVSFNICSLIYSLINQNFIHFMKIQQGLIHCQVSLEVFQAAT